MDVSARSLEGVQQRFNVSSDYFWIIFIHIDSDIGVSLVKWHALVINIFERVIAGRLCRGQELMKFDSPRSQAVL